MQQGQVFVLKKRAIDGRAVWAYPQVNLNEEAPLRRDFAEPSNGLEPLTPSLPWRFRSVTRVHARSLATHILLQIAPFDDRRCVARRRGCRF